MKRIKEKTLKIKVKRPKIGRPNIKKPTVIHCETCGKVIMGSKKRHKCEE